MIIVLPFFSNAFSLLGYGCGEFLSLQFTNNLSTGVLKKDILESSIVFNENIQWQSQVALDPEAALLPKNQLATN